MDLTQKIKRINELYHKSQSEGLTDEEKAEQQQLRKEYVASIKGSLKAQLDNIDIKEKDGTITNLGEQIRAKEAKNINNRLGNIRTKKALIRKEILEKRQKLSSFYVMEKSSIICQRIIELDEYKNSDTIFMYKAYMNEVSTNTLFEKAISDGKRVAFPKCEMVDGEPGMDFYFINNLNELASGYKGIEEPDIYNYELEKVIDFKGLCIVPAVVYDKNRNRIGYGKGFYDRFLRDNKELYTLGIAFDDQIVDEFETEESDVSIKCVITESNIY